MMTQRSRKECNVGAGVRPGLMFVVSLRMLLIASNRKTRANWDKSKGNLVAHVGPRGKAGF